MARKTADPHEAERAEARGIAVQLGRALNLTIFAARLEPGHRQEDAAIEAMDKAWTKLADKLIDFAGGGQ